MEFAFEETMAVNCDEYSYFPRHYGKNNILPSLLALPIRLGIAKSHATITQHYYPHDEANRRGSKSPLCATALPADKQSRTAHMNLMARRERQPTITKHTLLLPPHHGKSQ